MPASRGLGRCRFTWALVGGGRGVAFFSSVAALSIASVMARRSFVEAAARFRSREPSAIQASIDAMTSGVV